MFGMDERLDSLDRAGESYHWMKERRFQRMFREIEGQLSGVLGKGGYDWVDRRVFDQVGGQFQLLLYRLTDRTRPSSDVTPITLDTAASGAEQCRTQSMSVTH